MATAVRIVLGSLRRYDQVEGTERLTCFVLVRPFYNRYMYRNGEDNVKGPDEERDEEFATGPLSLLMQVSVKTCFTTCLFVPPRYFVFLLFGAIL